MDKGDAGQREVRRWKFSGRMDISTTAIPCLLRAIRSHQRPLRITLAQVGFDLTTVTSSHMNYKSLFEVQVIFSRIGSLPAGIVAEHLGMHGWLFYAAKTLGMNTFDILPGSPPLSK